MLQRSSRVLRNLDAQSLSGLYSGSPFATPAGGCRCGQRVPHGDGLRLPRGTSSVCALSLRAGASLRRALKSPTGAFSRAPLSPAAALRCGSGCAPAPRLRRRPPASARALRVARFCSPLRLRARCALLFSLRSALRLPCSLGRLLRLLALGRARSRLAIASALVRPLHIAPRRPSGSPLPAAWPLPLRVGGLSASPLAGSPPRVGAFLAPRRL